MTLAADTPTSAFPSSISQLLQVLRSRLPRSAPEAVTPTEALVRAMCHDMRSPLAALESVLARLDDDDPARPQLLELARSQIRHLSSMLRTADATGGACERRGTRLLSDVLRASVAAAGLPPQQLTLRVDEGAADVAVGDARVQRILTNLLENAHRHGEGRPVRLDVVRRDGWVRLAVTQAGMPVEVVVGRLSQQAPPVDLDGLGLWSVQRQTRELGGRLLWSSGPDGASTLVVALPDR